MCVVFLCKDDGRDHCNLLQGRRQVLHRPHEIVAPLALPATAKVRVDLIVAISHANACLFLKKQTEIFHSFAQFIILLDSKLVGSQITAFFNQFVLELILLALNLEKETVYSLCSILA